MKYEVYTELAVTDDFSVIDFLSVGKNGTIPKRIAFTATDVEKVFNLAFGDIDENSEIDDYTISDNGDRNKILATVANVIDDYTKRYPERWIIFRGSTTERTRLYRMAVSIKLYNFTAMKKVIKHKSDLLPKEVIYTVDENLNKLKGKVLAPQKLADANKLLKKLKTPLPE